LNRLSGVMWLVVGLTDRALAWARVVAWWVGRLAGWVRAGDVGGLCWFEC
jgi:hypothetical protein